MQRLRFLSGVRNSVELVLFECGKGNLLDSGISSAVLNNLIVQCSPSALTLLQISDNVSDYDSSQTQHMSKITLKKGDNGDTIWAHISKKAPKVGIHIVVLDGLLSIVNLVSLQTLIFLFHAARNSDVQLVFASWLYYDDFEFEKVQALRSLATGMVQVTQRAGDNSKMTPDDFEIWEDVVLRIARRKMSGRVNVDMIVGKFDAINCTIVECSIKMSQDSQNTANEKEKAMGMNLPFKLGLSEKEREARAAVVLPFIHNDASKADTALVLHPRNLQIDGDSDQSSGEESVDEYGEDIFSEDV